MVVMNKNAKAIDLDTKRFAEILKVKSTARNVLTNDQFELKSQLSILPKSVQIFEIE